MKNKTTIPWIGKALLGVITVGGVVSGYIGKVILEDTLRRKKDDKIDRFEEIGIFNENIKKESKAIEVISEFLEEIKDDVEEVSIESEDGLTLRGKVFKAKDPAETRWVILVHGYKVDHQTLLIHAKRYHEAGINVLMFDHRASGKSDGEYIGMGILEKRDLIQWTQALIGKYPEAEIIYHGESMGGATVLMASGEEDLPQAVRGVIADCPYSHVWDILKRELGIRYRLPSFPFLYAGDIFAKQIAGYSFDYEGSVIKAVQNSEVATLLIHTEEDTFVPAEMSQAIFENFPHHRIERFVLKKGPHGMAKYLSPKSYAQAINSFVEDYSLFNEKKEVYRI